MTKVLYPLIPVEGSLSIFDSNGYLKGKGLGKMEELASFNPSCSLSTRNGIQRFATGMVERNPAHTGIFITGFDLSTLQAQLPILIDLLRDYYDRKFPIVLRLGSCYFQPKFRGKELGLEGISQAA